MKKTLFILSILALGFTECNKEIDQSKEEAPTVYQVCIPASMGADTKAVSFDGTTSTSTFLTTEKVYVYKQPKEKKEGAMLGGYLQPTNVSADGKTCDLTGSLTGTIEADDNLVLLYNLSYYDSNKDLNIFDYGDQNGTQAGVTDGATATVTVASYAGSGELITTTKAHFQNVQSMFRFQFASGGTPVSVKSVDITSEEDAIAMYYYPLSGSIKYLCIGGVSVELSTATTDPIYVALCMDESKSDGDELTFDVVDADNKLYTKTKAAPSGGFKNGRYYYNSAPIGLDYVVQLVKPTLSRSDGGNVSDFADANAVRCFYIKSPSVSGVGEAKGITMDMSGTSTEYWFYLESDADNTVNISNLTAAFDLRAASFIVSDCTLNLHISGTNIISCKKTKQTISADKNLKLSGNGTLTVTTNSAAEAGFECENYSGDPSTLSALAADGYTVTRSSRTDNPDGTYTWTYTVKPAGALSGKFTVNGSGKQVLFSQGNLQYNGASWSFHTNQYDWFSGSSSAADYPMDLFTWGNTSNPSFAGTDYDDGTTALTGSRDWGSNIGARWRTLTKEEWEYLFNTRTASTVNGKSDARYAKAFLFGTTHGVIIFPDSYTHPSDVAAPSGINSTTSTSWSGNQYNATDWGKMEAAGCVFLPAAGNREGSSLFTDNTTGYYWSSSPDTDYAYCLTFAQNSMVPAKANQYRSIGRSVRLVRDVE